jgi:hypothetical protein
VRLTKEREEKRGKDANEETEIEKGTDERFLVPIRKKGSKKKRCDKKVKR